MRSQRHDLPMRHQRPPKDGLYRARPRLSIRAADIANGDEAMPVMEGHFAVFNEWTEIHSYWEGNFMERIAPGAFKKTFSEQRDSMKVLFNHGMDFGIGDKPLGPIEDLREDDIGAFYAVQLLAADYVRELVPGLEANLYGASFRFRVIREEWVDDVEPHDENPKGLPERTLKELQVPEFGPVTFPAYPNATAGLRSMTDEFLIARFADDQEQFDRLLQDAADPEHFKELEPVRSIRNAPRLPRPTDFPSRTDDAPPAPPAAEEPSPDDAPLPSDAPPADDAAPEGGDTPPAAGEPEQQDTAPPEGADRSDAVTPEPGAATDPDEDARAAAQPQETPTTMTLTELRARLEEIRSRLTTIDSEHGDAELPTAAQTEHDNLVAEERSVTERIQGIETRRTAERDRVAAAAGRDAQRESGAHFNTPPEREADPYDREAVHKRARGASSDRARAGILRDAALRAVDEEKVLFHQRRSTDEAVKEHISQLLRREDRLPNTRSEVADRILATGSELYQRSFVKAISGAALDNDEIRALASFTAANGGYAVPYQLDPTIIHTSNLAVNPFRRISRVETTLTNEWRGVTSGSVTPVYAAEGAEVPDGTPTLGQPIANPERVHAFVPFTIEIEGDWSAALDEMAELISDGKDEVEAQKFLTGAGHASNEPEGLLTGATTTVATTGAAAFAVGDLSKLEEALPPRFRALARMVASRNVYNRVRGFDTQGGAALWKYLEEGLRNDRAGNTGAQILGYPAEEASTMTSTLTTGQKIAVLGDFRHFLIVDRIGMHVEIVPMLFGAAGRPTGQRGLYAIWRNTSKVLIPNAFRVLQTA